MSRRVRKEIDVEEARRLLSYDPLTGELRWKVTTSPRSQAGQLAGCIAKSPTGLTSYRVISVNYNLVFAHRLAFAIMVGEVPHEIDHENGNGLDNRWCNLRISTKAQNNANMRKRRGTRSAFKGVTYYKLGNKNWRARITVSKKERTIGYFATQEEAAAAYEAEAKIHFGEFARIA